MDHPLQVAGSWNCLMERQKHSQDCSSLPTGSWGRPLIYSSAHGRLTARDDLDTVGVKAGCSLHLWTRLDFDGAYTVVTAGFKDRLVSSSSNIYWYIEDLCNHRTCYGTETVQMDNPARTRGVSKVPWKCGICCLLLWTCAEGERYCGYSEKLILEKNFILDKIMLSHVSRHFFGNQSIHQRWHALKIFQPGQTKDSRFSSAVTKHWWPVEFSCAHAGPLRRCPSPSKTHQFQNIDHYLVKHASTYNTVQVRAGKSEGREKATWVVQ